MIAHTINVIRVKSDTGLNTILRYMTSTSKTVTTTKPITVSKEATQKITKLPTSVTLIGGRSAHLEESGNS